MTVNCASSIELLAPAGDAEAMRAAIANGADSVYFGLANFNARHRADNVAGQTLHETLSHLHAHNVHGYVAFNTLIFSDELEQACDGIFQIATAASDAVIIQDLGLLWLIGKIVPSLQRHASTQMTLSDARGIEVVRRLGISRVILARELSIADIAKITTATTTPVEVFCHGALCVAYSGQCLTSESIGGRSANRGQCAQACRLPYDLIVDGKQADQRDRQYLLSPQDLAAYDLIADLARIGVASVKIEGRLKSAQYVAATTAAYREAIDAATAGRPFALNRQREAQLTQSFSRGFTHGFLSGVNHQELVQGTFSKKRGLQVGTVSAARGEGVLIQLHPGESLKPGDGVVFDEGHPEQDEQGGRIYEVRPAPAARAARAAGGGLTELRFAHGSIAASAISPGALVWKTDDPSINRQLEQSYNRDQVVHREPLACEVAAVSGQRLRITLTDQQGRSVSVASDAPVEVARKFPLDEKLLRDQLGRLGGTPYELGEVHLHGATSDAPPDPVMAPKSVLNDLRRKAVEQLMAQRSESHTIICPNALAELRSQIAQQCPPIKQQVPGASHHLTVLVRTLDQLRAAAFWRDPHTNAPPAVVWCEVEDIRGYVQAVQIAREAGVCVGLATMRVIKPGEDGFLKLIGDCGPDAVLIRNLSSLAYMAEHYPQMGLVCDYSLNVANELTAWLLMEGHGWRPAGSPARLARLTPSHDLNAQQLEAMLSRISGSIFEVVLHQHMAMFHMEHCVYAHMLSNGKDYHDCGRPCEKHQIGLRDRVGVEHPLQADAGCRNTVYNGRPQSIAAYVPRLRELGVDHFRVELLRETAAQTRELLGWYANVLAGNVDTPRPRTRLKVLDLMGVTPGTMEFE